MKSIIRTVWIRKAAARGWHKVQDTFRLHKGHWVSDFPACSSVVLASAIGLLAISLFMQVEVGPAPSEWYVVP